MTDFSWVPEPTVPKYKVMEVAITADGVYMLKIASEIWGQGGFECYGYTTTYYKTFQDLANDIGNWNNEEFWLKRIKEKQQHA